MLTPEDCAAGDGTYLGDDIPCTDLNNNGHGDECECHGDSNCDGIVNFTDIDFFVAALVSPAEWEAEFPTSPTCDYLQNDANWDGIVNFSDIDLFVDNLVSGSCIPVP